MPPTALKEYRNTEAASTPSVPRGDGGPWFFVIPLCLASDRGLGPADLRVYGTLYRMAARRKKPLRITLGKLAELTGLHVRSLRRSLAKLEKTGWIRVHVEGKKHVIAVRRKGMRPYIHVPAELLNGPKSEAVVYGILRLQQGGKKTFRPNLSKISELSGYSRRQVHTAIDKLVENVWIERHGNRSNLTITVLDEFARVMKLVQRRSSPTPKAEESEATTPMPESTPDKDFTYLGPKLHINLRQNFTSHVAEDQFPSAKSDGLSSILSTSPSKHLCATSFRLGDKANDQPQSFGMERTPSVPFHPKSEKDFPPKCGDDPTPCPGTTTLGAKIDEISLLAAVIADLDAQIEALSAALSSAESEEERRGLEAEKLALVVEKKGYEERLARLLGQAPRGLLISEESLARYAPLEV